VPEPARMYLRHTEEGVSIRQLARAEGVHASTVLRRVRRIELRRDDPLVDEALIRLALAHQSDRFQGRVNQKGINMSAPIRKSALPGIEEEQLIREARRVLRRLTEAGALLAVAPEMEKAVVLKGTLRIAVLERDVAQAFALKDWIAVAQSGRVTTYEITASGRAMLRRLLEGDAISGRGTATEGGPPAGFAEAQAPFAAQHRDWAEGRSARGRINLAESPLGILARRRDKEGTPFLAPELVSAGERLREDFELAQMGPRVAQNWERFLTGGDRGSYRVEGALGGGSERARDRVALALRDLGPGLGDMALRCCCFLEGLETAEQRLGWSARSGKIVLRIALIRLKRHYDETYGGKMPMIG
jgi:transposase-like protein